VTSSDLLADRATAVLGDRHLVLVGLMGTGKSSAARRLARRLRRPLVDTDALVESRTGRNVREVFATSGEAVFRDLEAEVLASSIADNTAAVIAAAGGVVLRDSNRALLGGGRAVVVWLTADPEVLVTRVGGQGHRPALDKDPLGRLQDMHIEREALYREVAHVIIDTDRLTIDVVCDRLLGNVADCLT
jgi:shikimate kinase